MYRSRRALATAVGSASLMIATAPAVTIAAPVQTDERQMIVSVLDDAGAPVVGLSPADFVIREDGAAREVLRVAPARDGRQIALLVDTSQAAQDATQQFRRGVTAFIEEMHEGNTLSLIAFGGRPRILVEATSDLDRLRDGVGRIFGIGVEAAYLLDALAETARGFERRDADRPVIVILTTEGLDYSNIDSRPVLRQLDEDGIPMHAVVLRGRANLSLSDPSMPPAVVQDRLLERDMVLDRGTSSSGGFRHDLQTASGTEVVMRRVTAELRSQYLVTYARSGSLVPPDRIDVDVTRDGLTARGTPVTVAE
jgi:hypothetical protein